MRENEVVSKVYVTHWHDDERDSDVNDDEQLSTPYMSAFSLSLKITMRAMQTDDMFIQ